MDYETDFLDPYEEFEMRYAEEMELLREMEEDGKNLHIYSNFKYDRNIPVYVKYLAYVVRAASSLLKYVEWSSTRVSR